MKNAILVHGWASKAEYYNEEYPTASNSHWFPWLTKQLMVRDIHAVALEMPRGYYPEYDVWKKELERFEISSETVLVGHSCGAGFLVRWLGETTTEVGKVVLVAPWLGIDPGDDFDETFFDFNIDRKISKKTNGITLFSSNDDYQSIQQSVDIIRRHVDDVKYVELEHKRHFTLKDLGTDQFPELLAEIVQHEV